MYQVSGLALGDPRITEWDRFVKNSTDGSFFHLAGWQQVLADLGHQGFYLYATLDQQIVGVLPLARVKSRLFGDALVSTPFCVYGGALGTDDVKRLLEQSAITLAKELGVDHLELRYRQPQNNQLTTRIQHATFQCSLADTDAEILASVKKKQRAVIRQSLNQQLNFSLDDGLDCFYQTYSQSVRNLGTPVFSKAYFQSLRKVFGADAEILTVRKDGKAVSSVLSFYYKQQVLPYYGGGVSEARELKSNDYMYYQLMCHARADRDCNSYDFGRSKLDSGAYSYKKHWGMVPEELHYQYQLINASALPNLSPNNPKYQLFIKLWQKLPLTVSQWLGPKLSRYLG
ncbi:FemAB family XrtA/PEP-CTERM system-associated protein [Arsukibacterium indicum]|uniref:FemAB family PEP-CTERM system-associated protein n=1 Tax=Arsukibacterium indicum TaxID=2848612 RepID=A0ABS6MFV0_9GAMM|nr:FemAB family XrtA/PEP-CTERM system-associated protein [Arsukibacterium indicum]MBV2127692.1 FemAB family PEP-CTERM system-associated protein [Arsukibacterium indicum]